MILTLTAMVGRDSPDRLSPTASFPRYSFAVILRSGQVRGAGGLRIRGMIRDGLHMDMALLTIGYDG